MGGAPAGERSNDRARVLSLTSDGECVVAPSPHSYHTNTIQLPIVDRLPSPVDKISRARKTSEA